MTTYKCYTGLNVALVDLDDIVPQPTSQGLQPTRRTQSADGSVYDEGLYLTLEFSALDDVSSYTTLLTQFGLAAATTAAVTIYARNEQFAFARYNGLAVRPEPGDSLKWQYRPSDVTILIKNLVAL